MADKKSCSLPFLILTITDAHTDRERQIERQRDRETERQKVRERARVLAGYQSLI